jgi:hypothetical protein
MSTNTALPRQGATPPAPTLVLEVLTADPTRPFWNLADLADALAVRGWPARPLPNARPAAQRETVLVKRTLADMEHAGLVRSKRGASNRRRWATTERFELEERRQDASYADHLERQGLAEAGREAAGAAVASVRRDFPDSRVRHIEYRNLSRDEVVLDAATFAVLVQRAAA